MDLNKTGKFIADLRRQRGLTQKGLAEQLGVTDKAVSRWETGRGFPDISFLPTLAGVLGVSISEIVIGERITLQEKETAEIMTKMDETVATTLDYSQQQMRKNRRQAAAAISVLLLLGLPALLCGIVVWYVYLIQNFWSNRPSGEMIYMLLIFFAIPVGAPAAINGIRIRIKWLTNTKTYWFALLSAFLLFLAATAALYPEFYSTLTNISLLQYDFNDTVAYEVLFLLLPITLANTLFANTCFVVPRSFFIK